MVKFAAPCGNAVYINAAKVMQLEPAADMDGNDRPMTRIVFGDGCDSSITVVGDLDAVALKINGGWIK